MRRKSRWSIGIYVGDSPLTLGLDSEVKNPVLTVKDVTDVPADTVADPFLIQRSSTLSMFFEVLDARTQKGVIGLALSDDGFDWRYQHTVLEEPFHLSFPCVFSSNGQHYMVPETFETQSVRLYRAVDFPGRWVFERTLLEGHEYVDNSVFFYNGLWWMFNSTPAGDTLHLFYAPEPTGPWTAHPDSPVVRGDVRRSRPGGRVLTAGDLTVRYAQDGLPFYGSAVHVFQILELNTKTYREREVAGNPLLEATGKGWNAAGMHHVDAVELHPGKWIAAVDGNRRVLDLGFHS